jgi:hypothetical protein
LGFLFQFGVTDNQIAEHNLENLSLQAGAPLEDLLEEADEDVAERSADHGAIQRHLGDTRGEVVAALAPVMRNPRCKELLETGKGAGCEHLGAQRVALELLQVRLACTY